MNFKTANDQHHKEIFQTAAATAARARIDCVHLLEPHQAVSRLNRDKFSVSPGTLSNHCLDAEAVPHGSDAVLLAVPILCQLVQLRMKKWFNAGWISGWD